MGIERWLGMEQTLSNRRQRSIQTISIRSFPKIDRLPSLILLFLPVRCPKFRRYFISAFTQWGSSWTLKLLIDFRVCRRIHVVSWRGCNEEIRNLMFLFCRSDVKLYGSFVEHFRNLRFDRKKQRKFSTLFIYLFAYLSYVV